MANVMTTIEHLTITFTAPLLLGSSFAVPLTIPFLVSAQLAVPQAKPVGQHPPLSLAGHEYQPFPQVEYAAPVGALATIVTPELMIVESDAGGQLVTEQSRPTWQHPVM